MPNDKEQKTLNATLKSIGTPNDKGSAKGIFTFEEDGTPGQYTIYGLNAKYLTAPLTAGHVDTLAIEFKATDDGGYWVCKSWGAPKAKAPFGGGGGGPRLTPEQFTQEKRSILASVALKEARELACHPLTNQATDADAVIADGKKFFDALTSWVGL